MAQPQNQMVIDEMLHSPDPPPSPATSPSSLERLDELISPNSKERGRKLRGMAAALGLSGQDLGSKDGAHGYRGGPEQGGSAGTAAIGGGNGSQLSVEALEREARSSLQKAMLFVAEASAAYRHPTPAPRPARQLTQRHHDRRSPRPIYQQVPPFRLCHYHHQAPPAPSTRRPPRRPFHTAARIAVQACPAASWPQLMEQA